MPGARRRAVTCRIIPPHTYHPHYNVHNRRVPCLVWIDCFSRVPGQNSWQAGRGVRGSCVVTTNTIPTITTISLRPEVEILACLAPACVTALSYRPSWASKYVYFIQGSCPESSGKFAELMICPRWLLRHRYSAAMPVHATRYIDSGQSRGPCSCSPVEIPHHSSTHPS